MYNASSMDQTKLFRDFILKNNNPEYLRGFLLNEYNLGFILKEHNLKSLGASLPAETHFSKVLDLIFEQFEYSFARLLDYYIENNDVINLIPYLSKNKKALELFTANITLIELSNYLAVMSLDETVLTNLIQSLVSFEIIKTSEELDYLCNILEKPYLKSYIQLPITFNKTVPLPSQSFEPSAPPFEPEESVFEPSAPPFEPEESVFEPSAPPFELNESIYNPNVPPFNPEVISFEPSVKSKKLNPSATTNNEMAAPEINRTEKTNKSVTKFSKSTYDWSTKDLELTRLLDIVWSDEERMPSPFVNVSWSDDDVMFTPLVDVIWSYHDLMPTALLDVIWTYQDFMPSSLVNAFQSYQDFMPSALVDICWSNEECTSTAFVDVSWQSAEDIFHPEVEPLLTTAMEESTFYARAPLSFFSNTAKDVTLLSDDSVSGFSFKLR